MSDFWENTQQHQHQQRQQHHYYHHQLHHHHHQQQQQNHHHHHHHHGHQHPWVDDELPFYVSDRNFWNPLLQHPEDSSGAYTVTGPGIPARDEPQIHPHLSGEEHIRQPLPDISFVPRAQRPEESAPAAQPQSPRAQAPSAIPTPSSSLPSFPIHIPQHRNYDPLRLRRPNQDLVTSPAQHRLVAVHQDNWLDRTLAGDHDDSRFGYFPRALLGQPVDEVDTSTSSESADESLWGFDDPDSHLGGHDLGSSEQSDPDMPVGSRRHARTDVVDLTSLSTSPPEIPRARTESHKRAADSSAAAGPASKRNRISSDDNVDKIDLTNAGSSMEEKLLQAQRQEAIRSQQAAEEAKGPQNMGQRQCVICMESYTNATTTSCGHIYCHECLIQALMAGEKNSDRGVGTCPVCRKPINRKKQHHIIPISFMKKETYEKQQGKRLQTTG